MWDPEVYRKLARLEAELAEAQEKGENLHAKYRETCAERDHYKAVVEQIAHDGCGLIIRDAHDIRDCRTNNPDDPSEWCWCCIARNALEDKP